MFIFYVPVFMHSFPFPFDADCLGETQATQRSLGLLHAEKCKSHTHPCTSICVRPFIDMVADPAPDPKHPQPDPRPSKPALNPQTGLGSCEEQPKMSSHPENARMRIWLLN